MGATVGFVVLLTLLFPLDRASARVERQDCNAIRSSGEVVKNQLFEREVGRGLLFRLNPSQASNPPGWTIELRSRANPENDFLWVATPPYRFMNPRYLDTSYGYSAQQAVQMSERAFNFVLNDSDYEKMTEAVRKLLWPYNHSEAELAEAEKVLEETPTGSGRLHILDARLGGEDETEGRGWIESLRFEVELCFPEPGRPVAEIRQADFVAALEQKFLRDHPDYESVEEAVAICGSELVASLRVEFAELDARPGEEVVVKAASCFAGTGGIDLPAVFTLGGEGTVVELPIRRPEGNAPESRALWASLRGKLNLTVEDGRLVELYPVYAEGDANCCPSAGVRKFVYRWNGEVFVLHEVQNLPPEKN